MQWCALQKKQPRHGKSGLHIWKFFHGMPAIKILSFGGFLVFKIFQKMCLLFSNIPCTLNGFGSPGTIVLYKAWLMSARLLLHTSYDVVEKGNALWALGSRASLEIINRKQIF